MNLISRVREWMTPRPMFDDSKYEHAMKLTAEVAHKMRERADSPDPIHALFADVWFQNHDIALIADAYEMAQEARIYKGLSE